MKKPTIAKVRRIVKKANPDAKNLVISWDRRPLLCENMGYKFYSGIVSVNADGFRSKRMVVTADFEGTSVR